MLSRNLAIEQAKKGYRWCRSCGEPKIPPEEPHWKDQCSVCHAEDLPRIYCTECGEGIEVRALRWGRKKGFEVKRCYYCRNGQTKPHPVHGVKMPDRFYYVFSPKP